MINQNDDPYNIFAKWLQEAKSHPEISEPTAMALATCNKNAKPDVRIVLLKIFDQNGFCFFGNLNSVKFRNLRENPQAALDFFWMPLKKQVRIRGKVELVTNEEADEYFNSRRYESRISAIASKQSETLENPESFYQSLKYYSDKYPESKPVPRPDYWSGFRLKAEEIEFWLDGDFRRHERYLFKLKGDGWSMTRLYP